MTGRMQPKDILYTHWAFHDIGAAATTFTIHISIHRYNKQSLNLRVMKLLHL